MQQCIAHAHEALGAVFGVRQHAVDVEMRLELFQKLGVLAGGVLDLVVRNARHLFSLSGRRACQIRSRLTSGLSQRPNGPVSTIGLSITINAIQGSPGSAIGSCCSGPGPTAKSPTPELPGEAGEPPRRPPRSPAPTQGCIGRAR